MGDYKCENQECGHVFSNNNPLSCPKCDSLEFSTIYIKSKKKFIFIGCLMILIVGSLFYIQSDLNKNCIPEEIISNKSNKPKQTNKETSLTAEDYFHKAYNNESDWQYQIDNYTKCLRIDPDFDIAAYLKRGLAYGKLKNYKDAIADYTRAIRIEPDDPDSYFQRGAAYVNLGNYNDAIADFTRAIRIDPDDPDSYFQRGAAYDNLGNYNDAIADHTRAIRIDPDDPDFYYFRGAAYDNLGNYNDAIADFTRAIRIDPDDPYFYYFRGAAYDDLGNYNDAIADFKKCCNLGDKDCCEEYNNANAKINLKVGQKLYGGIIFYIDESGNHGLVASLKDLPGTYQWGCYKEHVDYNLPERSELGTGYQNTKDIVSQGCATENGGISAAQAALDYESEDSDWYLPSDYELLEMYISIGPGASQGNIGGFMYQYYLSSTGYDYSSAIGINFDDGEWGILFRNSAMQVRVIRAF